MEELARKNYIEESKPCRVEKEVSKEEIKQMIEEDEGRYKRHIEELVGEVIEKGVKVILVCGPSGSGKTTTAYNIRKELKRQGTGAYYFSMDNWYKTRDRLDIPRLPDGGIDYEHPEAIDLERLHDDIELMLSGVEVRLPVFNFVTQEMEYNGLSLQMEEGSILIIEGIHAFNEKLVVEEEMYRVYIEPEDTYINGDIITGRTLRVMRRIIRDKEHRGMSPEETIAKEPLVSAGEDKYIYPSKLRGVDKEINSFMRYELYLYYEGNQEAYEKVREVSGVRTKVCKEVIPEGSILEEFYL